MKNIVLCLLLSLACAIIPLNAAPTLENAAVEFSNFFKENSQKTVAVLPFVSKAAFETTAIQTKFIEALVASGKIIVIERDRIAQLLNEYQIEQSGLTDKERIGRLLQADYLVLGNAAAKSKTVFEVNARLVDVATSQIVKTVNFEAERNEIEGPYPVHNPYPSKKFLGEPLVQLAILLDTSSSMDGLLNQTRTQLWKIVNTLAGGEREGKKPRIEVALYEYGNSMLKESNHYVRQVLPFTTNLDQASEKLFELKTMGGLEYCGAALNDAFTNLEWKNYDDVYRVVFIAGNEPFTQGPIPFKGALEKARQKGIFVNTIFAGSRQQGIATQWLSAARLAYGDFRVIDQNQMDQVMATPYDEEIRNLGEAYNATVIPLGEVGVIAQKRMQTQDRKIAATGVENGALTERAQAKATEQYSAAHHWDLTSITHPDKALEEINKNDLPQTLREKPQGQIKAYVLQKQAERKKIQKRIDALTQKRNVYIGNASKSNRNDDFGRATQVTIRAQGKKRGFIF
ncbi:MAG TPA: CsgG/HfaB family protein [Turneriella sp.]|nr:CsgG/HfaB family protein [Turneriella sp.]